MNFEYLLIEDRNLSLCYVILLFLTKYLLSTSIVSPAYYKVKTSDELGFKFVIILIYFDVLTLFIEIIT